MTFWIMTAIIAVLAVLLVICVTLHCLLKKDISVLNQELQMIDRTNSNKRLTTGTFEKNVCKLCGTVNSVLDEQKHIVMESERSTREFRQAITNISHDLRTPLTSAAGFMQMLKSDKTPEQKKSEYIDIVEQRLNFLVVLMNHLFEYTRIIEGNIIPNEENVNISNELRNIISTYYESFTGAKFSVEIDIPDTPVIVYCDFGSFKRIVQNLIQNVLVHGTGYFHLAIDTDRQEIIFQNKIPNPENLDVESLFHRFYTADFSRTTGTTGLGLAIARELEQNMGGDIRAYAERDVLSIHVRLKFEDDARMKQFK